MLIVTKRRVHKGAQLTWCYGGCFDDAGEDSDQIVSDAPTSQSHSQPSQQEAAGDAISGDGGDGSGGCGDALHQGRGSVPDSVDQGGLRRGGKCSSDHRARIWTDDSRSYFCNVLASFSIMHQAALVAPAVRVASVAV